MHSEGNVNVWNDKVLRCSYLGLKVSHRLIKSLWRRPLVVTQNSDCSVSPVVGQQFLCHTVRLFRGWYNSHLYLNRKIMLRTHVTRLMHRHLKDKSFLCSSCHSHSFNTHAMATWQSADLLSVGNPQMRSVTLLSLNGNCGWGSSQ